MKEIISTTEAPAAIGPYSQAVKAGGLLFLSGQIPLVPASGEMAAGSIKEQTHQVFANIKGILAAESLGLENVVKCTVFLADLGDFQAMNEIYAGYFTEQQPARSCFQVAKLPKDALIEIEAVAAY